ncbi:MAG: serine/threonine protein kinase [Myxococcota bacterium]|nr:serine/threonine protein kinase [Myxococcota bacterium]
MANSPARSGVDVGSVIADTYIIERLIGEGGMGSVFLATHNRLPGKRVAIKMLHVELNNDEVLARFRREATIATQLDHPYIVRVDDFNVHEDGTPYLILEYLEGESLAQRLTHGPMPLDQVMPIVRMVGSAISAAHELGYVHRDLKPQNIFLIQTEVDGKLVEAAKVLDFGISKMRNSTTVKTQENTLLGTPQYMAPEQATGQHANVDERTDVFALGSIVYEMLTGKPAFSGESIPEVVFKVVYEPPLRLAEAAPHAPANIVAAVERAMQKGQDDRFPTVNAFVETLTGRPIVQRSSMISLSPDRPKPTTTTGKRVGQAAYASTVDSGSVAKSAAHVSPHAETLASHGGDEPTPAARRPRALMFGLALAGLLGAVIAIYFATRSGEDTTPKVALVEDAAAVDASMLGSEAVILEDAPSIEDAPPPMDAAIAKATDAGVKVGKPPAVNRNEGDPLAWEFLDKANAAYKAGDLDLAKLHCNSVADSSATATPVQRSLALLLRGTIHCRKQNIGGAQADLRAIPIASYKTTLIARCKELEQPLQ